MLFVIGTIVQYILLIISIVFLIWLSIIGIVYENGKCSSIELNKTISKSENFSLISSRIDSRLKLNHFLILGTHNSYHQENLFYKYNHPNIDQQLSFGVRQIELDIHLMKNNHLIYHLQLLDDKTSCYCFKECLIKIFQWKEKNRFRYPIYLFIEIKEKFYEDLLTGLTGGIKCQHFQEIKEQILEIFSLSDFILPKEIQGNKESIRLSLKGQREDELKGDYTYKGFGWPPVLKSLGKLVPVYIDDLQNSIFDSYSDCDSLKDFFLIAQRNVSVPYSSIISISNLNQDKQILTNNRNTGQIIRLLLPYGKENLHLIYQTFKEYVHIISSDSLQCSDTLLCQNLKNQFENSTILCNQYYAPTFCYSSIPFI